MPAPKATPQTATKPEDAWRHARLIPTTGIGGQDEPWFRCGLDDASSTSIGAIGHPDQAWILGELIAYLDLREVALGPDS